MVQITLAFVIILGYLISKGIIETQNLAAETAQLRKDCARLNQVVAEFSKSEAGQERRAGSRPNDSSKCRDFSIDG